MNAMSEMVVGTSAGAYMGSSLDGRDRPAMFGCSNG
jgi:hypothetical protein